jgi:putative transposase
MNGIIQQAVMRIKDDVGRALDAATIEKVCRTVGHTWRRRELDPAATLQGFLLQILHGNTACSHVPRLLGKQVTAKAYSLARSRLPLEVFQQLLVVICSRLQGCIDGTAHWRGHRVWVMDGTGCSMPDTQDLQKAFGQPPMQKAGCGFPVAHLLALFHVGTGMLVRVVAAPLRTGDMALAKFVHGELQSGDIVLADRAFGSFGHLAALAAMGAHGVFRIQQTRVVSFRQGRPPTSQGSHQSKRWSVPSRRWIKRLGHHDQIVEYIKPRVRPSWLTHEEWSRFPSSLRVREVRYSLTATGYRSRSVTLVTTLLDADRYPKQAITDLYGQRWCQSARITGQ